MGRRHVGAGFGGSDDDLLAPLRLSAQTYSVTIHTRQDLERLSRFSRQRFSHALMSDTKWRKLFVAVHESGWQPSLIRVKFVEADEPAARWMTWPGPDGFWGPPQWVDTFEFGPIELRSIEWLMIPATVSQFGSAGIPAAGRSQDIAAIVAALERVGQFPLEQCSEGLKIIGYQ